MRLRPTTSTVCIAATSATMIWAAVAFAAKNDPQPLPLPQTAQPALRHGVFEFTSYPEAWTSAQNSNQSILVFVTTPQCSYCRRMIVETFRDAAIRQLLPASFETVYVDRVSQPKLAAKLKPRIYPTTLLVKPNNKVTDVIEGYVDAATLRRRLRRELAGSIPAKRTR